MDHCSGFYNAPICECCLGTQGITPLQHCPFGVLLQDALGASCCDPPSAPFFFLHCRGSTRHCRSITGNVILPLLPDSTAETPESLMAPLSGMVCAACGWRQYNRAVEIDCFCLKGKSKGKDHKGKHQNKGGSGTSELETFPFVPGRACTGFQQRISSFLVSCLAGIDFQQSNTQHVGSRGFAVFSSAGVKIQCCWQASG